MSQAQKIPFLNLFSAWRPGEELAALAGGYLVTGAVIDKAARSIRAKVECPRMPEEKLRIYLSYKQRLSKTRQP